jgi:hypothetical protein
MNAPQSFSQQLDSIFLDKAKIQIDCDRSQALDSGRSLYYYTVTCNDWFNYEPSAPSSAICKSVKPIYESSGLLLLHTFIIRILFNCWLNEWLDKIEKSSQSSNLV